MAGQVHSDLMVLCLLSQKAALQGLEKARHESKNVSNSDRAFGSAAR